MKKKQKLSVFRVTKTVQYTMLISGTSKRDALSSHQLYMPDICWDKSEPTITIEKVEI